MKKTALEKWICQLEGLSELTRNGLEELQLQRLNELLAKEKARGGFYKGLPGRLDSLSDLSSLPFTTAEDLAANCQGLLLTSLGEVRRIISGATSGTTGPAKRVFYTQRDLAHTVGFFAAGISEFVRSGDAVLIAMPFSGPDGLGELICRAVESLGGIPVRAGIGMALSWLDTLLDGEKPAAYIGMPVPLLSLLRWRRMSGRPLFIERALISADACPEGVCDEIETLLGTRLFPHYGSREVGLGGAVTCGAHEGMHLRENHILAEIVAPDGSILPEGELGELVVTTLDMEAMPLIRYRTGDYTRFLPTPCACGGVTRRIGAVHRMESALMEELDSRLFRLPGLIDCAAEIGAGGRIKLIAEGRVSAAEIASALPEHEVDVHVLPITPEFHGFYAGKRSVLRRI